MSENKDKLPKTVVRRLMKQAGARLVAADAVDYMEHIAKDFIQETTDTALKLMEIAGRKTLMPCDIENIQIYDGKDAAKLIADALQCIISGNRGCKRAR